MKKGKKRKALGEIEGKRLRFQAIVERFGTKPGWDGGDPIDTILFKNICRLDSGTQVSDHLWFTVGKTIATLALQPGDTVQFDARVATYEKGYVNHRQGIDQRSTDYKLSHPTKFAKISVEQDLKQGDL